MATRKVTQLRLPLECVCVTASQPLSQNTTTPSVAIEATGETKVISHRPMGPRSHVLHDVLRRWLHPHSSGAVIVDKPTHNALKVARGNRQLMTISR
jgi:hypothetical protein